LDGAGELAWAEGNLNGKAEVARRGCEVAVPESLGGASEDGGIDGGGPLPRIIEIGPIGGKGVGRKFGLSNREAERDLLAECAEKSSGDPVGGGFLVVNAEGRTHAETLVFGKEITSAGPLIQTGKEIVVTCELPVENGFDDAGGGKPERDPGSADWGFERQELYPRLMRIAVPQESAVDGFECGLLTKSVYDEVFDLAHVRW
jgi:hypothetical protein